jgi:tRNA G18 (ribose-2'-O)-methylase SpoU
VEKRHRQLIKYIVKLRDDKKQRIQDDVILVEGYDEIQLALSAGYKPQTLLSAPELASKQLTFSAAETLTVSRAVFEKMSYRDNPDGWLAIFPVPHTTLADLKLGESLAILGQSSAPPMPLMWTPSCSVTRAWMCGIPMWYAPAAGQCSAYPSSSVIMRQRWNG